jgi:hypothetical protein
MESVTKVQVGCGPHALLEGWCNTEGVRGQRPIEPDEAIRAWIEHDFLRHVRGGH